MLDCVPDVPHGVDILADAHFWLQDLRLGRYAEVVRHLGDPDYRAERVAALLPTARALRVTATLLGLPTDGASAALRARLVEAGVRVGPFLLAADFSRRKDTAAVLEVAEATLPAEAVAGCRDRLGRPDRLALVLHLVHVAPAALLHVRGLDAWLRHEQEAFVLEEPVEPPAGELLDWLTPERVEETLAPVPRPAGVPPVRFEFAVARPDDGVLLGLRRNLRRAHLWSDDGVEIAHGHDEELIFLQFLDRGRRLRLVSATPALPRRLADALASAWFGRPCRYVEDLLSAHPAAVRRLVSAAVRGRAQGLRLIEVVVRRAPLAGQPGLSLRAQQADHDIAPALAQFEAHIGPVVSDPDRMQLLRLAFGDREVVVAYPGDGAPPSVRFSDRRLPLRDAEAFRALVAAQFGLGEHQPGDRGPVGRVA